MNSLTILGEGEFGWVYKAKYKNQTVAVKKLKEHVSRREYEAEVKVLKSLRHPNVIKYYEWFEISGSVHIVFEYAEFGSLHTMVQLEYCPLTLENFFAM